MVDKSFNSRIHIKILEFSKNWNNKCSKKIIFNLKKIKNQIAPQSEGDLRNEHVNKIADKLDVSEEVLQ